MGTGRKILKFYPFFGGLAVVLVVGALAALGVFAGWENRALDILERRNAGRVVPDDRIVMVAITTDGMTAFQAYQVLWPWPRDLWARLVESAEQAGARAVVFDILLDSPGIDQANSSGVATDLAFADKLTGGTPVVLAAQLVPELAVDSPATAGVAWAGDDLSAYDLRGYKLRAPHDRFRAATLALANAIADDDGVFRHLPLLWNSDYGKVPGLALRAATSVPQFDPRKVAMLRNGEVLLRFYGPGGPGGPFPYVDAFDLITGSAQIDLRGKILFVGAYAAGLLDYKPTAVASGTRPFPGFELHATLLSNILQGHAIRVPSPLASLAFLVLAGLGALGAMSRGGSNGAVRIGLVAGVVMVYLVAADFAFRAGMLLPIVSTLTACSLGVGAHIFLDWRSEGRRRREMRSVFSRYLHTSVIDELIKDPESAHLEGCERRVTVMFADIVGFTTASERLAPAEVVLMLNSYFRDFVDIILKHNGFLDKFIGDAVMTLFGVPIASAQTQSRAAEAVLEIQAVLRAKNAARVARGVPAVNMNIGMHTDTVIIGNIGHPQRMDYTAIGSGVNTASRIEGANRYTGTRNLVSEQYCQDLPESFRRREIGRLGLKGQIAPLRVFELIEPGDDGPWVDHWAEAWTAWRAGRRQEALAGWQAVAKQRPDDPAIPIFLRNREVALDRQGDESDVLVLAGK